MGKHPDKQSLPEPRQNVVDAVAQKAADAKLSCAEAFALARELGCPPLEVGAAMDRLKVKIVRCQLGLFGYGDAPKPADEKEPMAEGLAEAVQEKAGDGRLACRDAWAAAAARNLPKLSVGRAANALGLRIRPCQLGAF